MFMFLTFNVRTIIVFLFGFFALNLIDPWLLFFLVFLCLRLLFFLQFCDFWDLKLKGYCNWLQTFYGLVLLKKI